MINGAKFAVLKGGKQIAICGTIQAAIVHINNSPMRAGMTIAVKRSRLPWTTVYDTSWLPYVKEDAQLLWCEFGYGEMLAPICVYSIGKTWCMDIKSARLDSDNSIRLYLVPKGATGRVWIGESLFAYALPDVYNVVMKRLETWK